MHVEVNSVSSGLLNNVYSVWGVFEIRSKRAFLDIIIDHQTCVIFLITGISFSLKGCMWI